MSRSGSQRRDRDPKTDAGRGAPLTALETPEAMSLFVLSSLVVFISVAVLWCCHGVTAVSDVEKDIVVYGALCRIGKVRWCKSLCNAHGVSMLYLNTANDIL